jgi:hypothetical protein
MIALETVGFAPCYHMRNLLSDLEHGLPLWEAVAEGRPDWDAIFGDSQSTCDWPSARFYKELAELYPDAKVILTIRDGSSWVQSMRETVWALCAPQALMHHLSEAQATIDPLWRRYIDLMGRFNWDDGTGAFAPWADTFDDQRFAAAMDSWNDEVKRTVPAERLLVWDPREGWEPMCDFLEVGVPADPLPHTNDKSAFKEGIMGGAVSAINAWWDARERPSESLHGAAIS